MLCNYLNNVYLEHIHPNLTGDEFIYSAEVKETFLDIWNSVDGYKICPKYSPSIFYMKNNEIIFELYSDYCFNFNVSIFHKYDICEYDLKNVIKNIINKSVVDCFRSHLISEEFANDIKACELKQKTTQFDLSGL